MANNGIIREYNSNGSVNHMYAYKTCVLGYTREDINRSNAKIKQEQKSSNLHDGILVADKLLSYLFKI